MKRIVTVTFEFEDAETSDQPGRRRPSKATRKAMEIASCAFGAEGFSHAELDGDFLMDKDGNASDEVKILPEYAHYMCLVR